MLRDGLPPGDRKRAIPVPVARLWGGRCRSCHARRYQATGACRDCGGPDLADQRAVQPLQAVPPEAPAGHLSLLRAPAADRRGGGLPVLPGRPACRPGTPAGAAQAAVPVRSGRRGVRRLPGGDPADQRAVQGLPRVSLGAPGRAVPLLRAPAADRGGGGLPVLPGRAPRRPGPAPAAAKAPARARAYPCRLAAACVLGGLRAGPRLGAGHPGTRPACAGCRADQQAGTRPAAVGRRAPAAVRDQPSPGGAAGRRVPHRRGAGPRQPAGCLGAMAGPPARRPARTTGGRGADLDRGAYTAAARAHARSRPTFASWRPP